jgi:serine/threonine protein kinase
MYWKGVIGAVFLASLGSADRLDGGLSSQSSANGPTDFHYLHSRKGYDPRFTKPWEKMASNLWSGMSEAFPSDARPFLRTTGEATWKAPQLIAHSPVVDCKSLDLDLKHLKPIRLLHKGGKSCVILMQDKKSDRQFVLKTVGSPDHFAAELNFPQFIPRECPYFVHAVCHRRCQTREIEKVIRKTPRPARHSSTDTSSSSSRDKNNDENSTLPAVLYEYVPGGRTSYEYAKKASYHDLKRLTAQFLVAVELMHYLDFLHSDLKPDNVLVADDGTLKIIDYGFTVRAEYGKTRQGTRETMAPELHGLVPGRVHEGVDWWAFAITVIMWFAAHFGEKCSPFKLQRDSKLTYAAGKIPKQFPAELRSFLLHFLVPDPDTRIFNSKRLLGLLRQHRFFDDINWNEIYGGNFEYP